MIKIFRYVSLFCAIMHTVSGISQDSDSTKNTFSEKAKKGWNFGLLPAVAFDADLGFRYGAIVNAFNYGDGSHYPKYDHNIYVEWSKTTKGNNTAILACDSEHLIPGLRFSLNLQYLTEKALDFYGFNGYKAYYNHEFENQESDLYKSRMFYRIDRKFVMALVDFQKDIVGENIKMVFGLNYYDNRLGSVDIDKLNEGKDAEDLLPSLDSVPGLFEYYKNWNVLPENEVKGGSTGIVKIGLVYDTRDNEPNPMKGMWSEALLLYAPDLGKDFSSYSQLSFTHRHYFTLKEEVLNLACRMNYQTKFGGDMPFYMLPFVLYSNKPTRDGLGGAKTLRGIRRDRVAGEGMAYGNVELRWKFFRSVIGGQNIYLAWSGFCDGGIVTKKYNLNLRNVPASYKYLFPDEKETMHISYGTGFHFVMNRNFIVAIDYGMPLKHSDGTGSLYINLDFLF